jgi:hypothetical protein
MFTIAAMPASEALSAFEANVPRVSITSKTMLIQYSTYSKGKKGVLIKS